MKFSDVIGNERAIEQIRRMEAASMSVAPVHAADMIVESILETYSN